MDQPKKQLDMQLPVCFYLDGNPILWFIRYLLLMPVAYFPLILTRRQTIQHHATEPSQFASPSFKLIFPRGNHLLLLYDTFKYILPNFKTLGSFDIIAPLFCTKYTIQGRARLARPQGLGIAWILQNRKRRHAADVAALLHSIEVST